MKNINSILAAALAVACGGFAATSQTYYIKPWLANTVENIDGFANADTWNTNSLFRLGTASGTISHTASNLSLAIAESGYTAAAQPKFEYASAADAGTPAPAGGRWLARDANGTQVRNIFTSTTPATGQITLAYDDSTPADIGWHFHSWAWYDRTGFNGDTLLATTVRVSFIKDATFTTNSTISTSFADAYRYPIAMPLLKKNSYTVEYDANGGTFTGSAPSSFTVVDGSGAAIAPSSTPVRTGCKFKGWALAANASAPLASPYVFAATKANGWRHGDKITLYAVWESGVFSLTAKASPADGGIVTGSGNYTVFDKAPLTAVANPGYVFRKWSPSGATAASWDAAPVVSNTVHTAIFDPIAYKVRFNANASDASGWMAVQDLDYGEETPLTTNAYSRTHWTFAGWSYDKDSTHKDFSDGEHVKNLSTIAGDVVDLYALWRVKTYSFNVAVSPAQGGIVTGAPNGARAALDTITVVATPTKGYRFTGWSDGVTSATNTFAIAGNTSLTANFSPVSYTVSYNRNGRGSGTMPAQTLSYGEETSLSAENFSDGEDGYIFAGWSLDRDGGAAFADGASVSNLSAQAGGRVELFAVWQPANDRCSFTVESNPVAGGVASSSVAPGLYLSSLETTLSATPNEGWKFTRWAHDGSTETVRTATVSGLDKTFTALFEPIEYSVRFNAADESGRSSFQSFKHGTAQALTANSFAVDGKLFVCWTNSTGRVFADGETVENLSSTDGDIVDLYAVWRERGSFTLNLVALATNSYEIVETEPWLLSEHSVTLADMNALAVNTLSGLAFAGWWSEDLSRQYFDEDISTNTLPELTLVAKWITTNTPGETPQTWSSPSAGTWSAPASSGTGEVSLTANGAGVLSFKWFAECSMPYVDESGIRQWGDYAALFVDGEEKLRLAGSADWLAVQYTNTLAGTHVYSWKYLRDSNSFVTLQYDDRMNATPAYEYATIGYEPYYSFEYTDAAGVMLGENAFAPWDSLDVEVSVVDGIEREYDGTAFTPDLVKSISHADASALYSVDGGEFTSSAPSFTSAGIYTVRVTANAPGKTVNTNSVVVVVTPRDFANVSIAHIPVQTFAGAAVEPALSLVDSNGRTLSASDWSAAYSGNTSPGTAYAVVTPRNNYTGAAQRIAFTIVKDSISATIGASSFEYDGTAHALEITPSAADASLTFSVDGADATSEAPTFTGAGSYSVVVTAAKEGFVSFSTQLVVRVEQRSLASPGVSVEAIPAQTWTGKPIMPEVRVLCSGVAVPASSLSLSYEDNISAGTATVAITGQGDFTGQIKAHFAIVYPAISLSLSNATFDYNGTARSLAAAQVSPSWANVSYSASIAYTNAGTYRVTATASADEYASATASATLVIKPRSIANATIASIATQTYTGSALTPPVTIRDSAPISSADYTISYANNIAVGTATVTVTGRRNYTGTKTATFAIEKPATPVEPDPPPEKESIARLLCTDTSSAYAGTAASKFNGYLYDSSGSVRGTVLVQAGKWNAKTQTAAVTVKVRALGTSSVVTFKGKYLGSTLSLAANAHKMELALAADGFTGTYDGYFMDGARNIFLGKSASDKARAASALAKYRKSCAAILSAAGNGIVCVSFSISVKGVAKATGFAHDGTKISVSGLQLCLADDGATAAIPFAAPMYAGKKGGFGFVYYMKDSVREIARLGNLATATASVSLAVLDAGSYESGSLSGSRKVSLTSFPASVGGVQVLSQFLPQNTSATISGNKITLPKGAAVKFDKSKNEFVTSTPANPASLKLSLAAATGTMKGSFAVYLANPGATKAKKISAKVSGAVCGAKAYLMVTIPKGGTCLMELK